MSTKPDDIPHDLIFKLRQLPPECSILIVGSDNAICDLVKNMCLQAVEGYSPQPAFHYSESYDTIRQDIRSYHPHVIFSTGSVDGVGETQDLVEQLRRLSPHTAVVRVSGHIIPKKDARQSTAIIDIEGPSEDNALGDYQLPKPFRHAQLSAALTYALDLCSRRTSPRQSVQPSAVSESQI